VQKQSNIEDGGIKRRDVAMQTFCSISTRRISFVHLVTFESAGYLISLEAIDQ
jgi:hypothetical protein